jgi:hypothetical protein
VRNAQRLKLVRRLDKYQIDRSGDDAIVTCGALQEGIGWAFGPFERQKEVANALKEAIAELEIDSDRISAVERANRIWELVSLMSNRPSGRTGKQFSQKSSLLSILFSNIFAGKDKAQNSVAQLVEKHKLGFDESKLPRTGVSVISNPETKDLDIFVFIRGTLKKILRIAPEESNKLGTPRFFTRLFQNCHSEIKDLSSPILFTEDKCVDIELLAAWRRASEGEWADFSQLESLYQPED